MSSVNAPTVPAPFPVPGFNNSVKDDRRAAAIVWRGPQALEVRAVARGRIVCLLACFFGAMGVIGSIWLAQQSVHDSALVLAIVLSLELFCVPLLVRHGQRVDIGGALVMAGVMGFIGLASFLAGGLNQPILLLVTALPVLATVMLTPRAGAIVAMLTCGVLAWLVAMHNAGVVAPMLQVDGLEQPVLRIVVLMLVTVLVASLVWVLETQVQRRIERYRERVEDDVVTGLPNRWVFEDGLRRSLAQPEYPGSQPYLILLEIDQFPAYQKVHGHAAGDALLQQLGRALVSSALNPGALATRMDGHCFAMLNWCASRSTLRAVHDRLQLLASGVFHAFPELPGQTLSLSIGTASVQDWQSLSQEAAAEQLYARASEALVMAQGSSSNSLHVSD